MEGALAIKAGHTCPVEIRPLKIIHVADTHIGFAAYRKVCEDEGAYKGLNQREVDVYRVFESFVDEVLKARPDAVLHAGDPFDTVRPTNRALSFALEQLLRISDAGIPVVMIAGNHSTPRLRETGSVFRLFEHLKGVHPVYKGVTSVSTSGTWPYMRYPIRTTRRSRDNWPLSRGP